MLGELLKTLSTSQSESLEVITGVHHELELLNDNLTHLNDFLDFIKLQMEKENAKKNSPGVPCFD